MNIIFMRHGEATDNIREILSDKEIYFSILTDAGFSEAAQTIKSIDKVDKIYISPLPRTIQTAKILYEKFPTAEAVIDDRLREIQYGRYSGQKNNSSLDIIREKQIAGDYFTRFGKYGDNKFDIEMRLSLFLRDMSTRNFDNNTIAIVSHGSVISFMKRILNLKTPHTKTGKAEFFTINDWSDLNDRIKHLETIADARKHTFNREVDHIENVDVQNKYRYIVEELYNSVELPESTLGWLVKGHNDDLAVEQEATFDPNKPILICPFYNFDNFAQKWFEHYRGLGVVNYIMIDNNSTDLNLDIIKSQNNGLNIKIMKASGRYNCFRACGWRQQIMDKCGQNKWYLNVDSDELFSYDNSDRVNINDFIKKLDGFKLVKSLMVDVYPRGPVLEVSSVDEFQYVDKNTYMMSKNDLYGDRFYGGPRFRVVGIQPSLQKIPLIFYTGQELLINDHYYYPGYINKESVFRSYLLHYKFLPGDMCKYKDFAESGVHYDNSKEYKHYLSKVTSDPGFKLFDESVSIPVSEFKLSNLIDDSVK